MAPKIFPWELFVFFGEQTFPLIFKTQIWPFFQFSLMAFCAIFEMLQCYNSVTRIAQNPMVERFLKKRIERLYIAPFGQRGFFLNFALKLLI